MSGTMLTERDGERGDDHQRPPSPPPSPPFTPAPPADASMDLLNQIVRQPYDPDYAVVAARGSRPTRFRLGIAVTALLIGALFAVAALQTTRAAPVAERERTALIARVQAAQSRQDDLRQQVIDRTEEVNALRSAGLGNDTAARATQATIDRLTEATAGTAVGGPGLVVVVDDAADGSGRGDRGTRGRVTGQDMQVLANGLWAAGAEAVAINGHRVSGTTAIREAGGAITVDYTSITRPYTVTAIGDPKTFAARYAQSAAAVWWSALQQTQDMRYEVGSRTTLNLAADPAGTLRFAEAAR